MSFTAVNTNISSGDTLAAAFTKINDGFTDTLREIVMGAVPGWNWSYTGADPAAPTAEVWASGTARVRATYTYTSGKITQTVYAVSTNSGTSYATKGTLTYTYNGSGYITAMTWS